MELIKNYFNNKYNWSFYKKKFKAKIILDTKSSIVFLKNKSFNVIKKQKKKYILKKINVNLEFELIKDLKITEFYKIWKIQIIKDKINNGIEPFGGLGLNQLNNGINFIYLKLKNLKLLKINLFPNQYLHGTPQNPDINILEKLKNYYIIKFQITIKLLSKNFKEIKLFGETNNLGYFTEYEFINNYLKLKKKNETNFLIFDKKTLKSNNFGTNFRIKSFEKHDIFYIVKFFDTTLIKIYYYKNDLKQFKFKNIKENKKITDFKILKNYYLIKVGFSNYYLYEKRTINLVKMNLNEKLNIKNFIEYKSFYEIHFSNNEHYNFDVNLKLINLNLSKNNFSNFNLKYFSESFKILYNYEFNNYFFINNNKEFIKLEKLSKNEKITDIFIIKSILIIKINNEYYNIYDKESFNLIIFKELKTDQKILEIIIKKNYFILKNSTYYYFFSYNDLNLLNIEGISKNDKINGIYFTNNKKFMIIFINNRNYLIYNKFSLIKLKEIKEKDKITSIIQYNNCFQIEVNHQHYYLYNLKLTKLVYINKLNKFIKIVDIKQKFNYFILTTNYKNTLIYDKNFDLVINIKNDIKNIIDTIEYCVLKFNNTNENFILKKEKIPNENKRGLFYDNNFDQIIKINLFSIIDKKLNYYNLFNKIENKHTNINNTNLLNGGFNCVCDICLRQNSKKINKNIEKIEYGLGKIINIEDFENNNFINNNQNDFLVNNNGLWNNNNGLLNNNNGFGNNNNAFINNNNGLWNNNNGFGNNNNAFINNNNGFGNNNNAFINNNNGFENNNNAFINNNNGFGNNNNAFRNNNNGFGNNNLIRKKSDPKINNVFGNNLNNNTSLFGNNNLTRKKSDPKINNVFGNNLNNNTSLFGNNNLTRKKSDPKINNVFGNNLNNNTSLFGNNNLTRKKSDPKINNVFGNNLNNNNSLFGNNNLTRKKSDPKTNNLFGNSLNNNNSLFGNNNLNNNDNNKSEDKTLNKINLIKDEKSDPPNNK